MCYKAQVKFGANSKLVLEAMFPGPVAQRVSWHVCRIERLGGAFQPARHLAQTSQARQVRRLDGRLPRQPFFACERWPVAPLALPVANTGSVRDQVHRLIECGFGRGRDALLATTAAGTRMALPVQQGQVEVW